jgi:hypothetical protein
MINHQVDRTKWAKMSLIDQMGNISSEVGRAIIEVSNHLNFNLQSLYALHEELCMIQKKSGML